MILTYLITLELVPRRGDKIVQTTHKTEFWYLLGILFKIPTITLSLLYGISTTPVH